MIATSRLASVLADNLANYCYSVALLSEFENNLNFEIPTLNTGYERAKICNSIATIRDSGVRVIGDPVVFYCKGNTYNARRAALLCDSLHDNPILGYLDVDNVLMDGDKLTLDLSHGFIQFGY